MATIDWIYSNADWLTIFVITTLFTIITIRYYTKKDQYESEPKWRLLWALFLGVVSVGPALLFSSLLLIVIPHTYSTVIVAPIAEEIAKGLFVLWLARNNHFDGPLDGLIYGAMVGTGFAYVENILYAMNALGTSGAVGGIFLAGFRSVFEIIGHPLYTGTFGIGVGASKVGLNYRRILRLLEAMALHSFWNSSSWFGINQFLAYLIVTAVAIIILHFEVKRVTKLDKKAYERGYYDNEDVSYLGN